MISNVERRGREGTAGCVRLNLLGCFDLVNPDRAISLPMGAQRLVAILAAHEGRMFRLYLAGMLWPDTPEDQARANLRSALWRLREPGVVLVEGTRTHLWLAEDVWVDLHQARASAQRLLNNSWECADEDCHELLRATDLLPDWYDDWVLFERERFRQLRLHALEVLSARLTATGRFGLAIEAGLMAVQAEPLRESAQRVLIQAHLAEGNRCEAVRQYDLYKRLLREELGVEPSSKLDEMVRPPAVAVGSAGLVAA